jgi:Xaa-Pro dipeptidase
MRGINNQQLTSEEKSQISIRAKQAIADEGLDAVLVAGGSNITYLTGGVVLPFTDQASVISAAVFVTTQPEGDLFFSAPDLASVVSGQADTTAVEILPFTGGGSPEVLAGRLVSELKRSGFARGQIGFDGDFFPQALVNALGKASDVIHWTDCSDLLSRLKMIKTDAEIRLLTQSCRIADRAIVSALNHTEGNVSDSLNYHLWEFTERIRVHVGEFCGSATGHVMTAQGKNARQLHRVPGQHEMIETGSLIRCELTSHHFGYWADSARTVIAGHASALYHRAYADNVMLKKTAIEKVKPGVSCGEIFDQVAETAWKHGIRLYAEPSIGGGVGTAEREAPYLVPGEPTIIKPGMVIVIGPYTLGPDDELICSKDTYEITSNGARLMSWYRNYDRMYEMIGSSARHG